MGRQSEVETNVRELIEEQKLKLAELEKELNSENDRILKLKISLATCKLCIEMLEKSLITKKNETEKIDQ